LNNTNSEFQITPDTKIGALLDKFPQLEEVLTKMAPEFKKLRNPILRKTIAKIASLRQVASLGKVSLPEMINTLRAEAGIQDKFLSSDSEKTLSKDKPSWFSDSKIILRSDIRPMLESGEQPIQHVLRECQKLKPDEIFEVISPFLPAPLIEQASKQGFTVWSKEESPDVYKTYFTLKIKAKL
jgi:hypothetical protein